MLGRINNLRSVFVDFSLRTLVFLRLASFAPMLPLRLYVKFLTEQHILHLRQ
jgi:hypothetical protein